MKASVEFNGLEPNQLAQQVASQFTQWNMGRQKWLDRVKEVIQYVYATSTRETTNSKNPWSHSTVIPKLTQIHDNLGANYASALFGNREFFTFEPATINEATVGKRNAIVNYLRTKHDYNSFSTEMKKSLNDWVQTGNCFGWVEYVRETTLNQDGGEDIVYEGPKYRRISPYDIVFDHTVSEFKNSPKIVRELLTRGELFRRAEGPEGEDYDPAELARIKKFYSVIGNLKDADINKSIQMTMDGFTNPASYFRSGRVELLHFMGDIFDSTTGELKKDCLITIVDRRYLLRVTPLNDLQGYGRVYHCGWRKRTDNLWAQGPLDNIVGLQYRMNHLENARSDAFDQMLSPDRVHIGNVEIEKDGPVTNYYVDDAGGDVKNLAPDATVLSADNQIQLIEAQMEAFAGAPREAMGIRTPGEKTAFEVQQLQNAASRLFQTKIEDFEAEFLEPVLNGELEVAVRNLNTSDVAKVLDEDFGVTEFITITKDDLTSKGKLKARGASHFAKRAQLVQELQSFSNVLGTDPDMKVHFPAQQRAKVWATALGFDRYELFSPFGQVDEQVELQKALAAAQQQADEFNAALQGQTQRGLTDAEAAARAARAGASLQ